MQLKMPVTRHPAEDGSTVEVIVEPDIIAPAIAGAIYRMGRHRYHRF